MNAVQTLLEAGICTLPVDLSCIAEYFNIKTVDYEAYARCYELEAEQMYNEISTGGFSFFEDGRFVCVINGKACGKMRRRWTFAHELGHILLGHISEDGDKLSAECEREAEIFASELLAPLDILHFCGVSSPEEIARLCGLSKQAADFRYEELSKLRRQHSAIRRSAMQSGDVPKSSSAFMSDEQRKQLFEQFLPFIADYITERARHDDYIKYVKRLNENPMMAE